VEERERRNWNNASVCTVKALALREESSCFEGVEAGHIRKLTEKNRLNITTQLRAMSGKQSFCGGLTASVPWLPHKERNFIGLGDQ